MTFLCSFIVVLAIYGLTIIFKQKSVYQENMCKEHTVRVSRKVWVVIRIKVINASISYCVCVNGRGRLLLYKLNGLRRFPITLVNYSTDYMSVCGNTASPLMEADKIEGGEFWEGCHQIFAQNWCSTQVGMCLSYAHTQQPYLAPNCLFRVINIQCKYWQRQKLIILWWLHFP